MKTQLTRIGNSRGIRIPKPLIDQCGLNDQIELRVSSHGLLLVPYRPARDGWKQVFAENKPEKESLLLNLPPSTFDRKEWEW